VKSLRPHVIVTYNGDFFDWPYVDTRCGKFGISLYKELGIRGSSAGATDGEYVGRCLVHLDAFCWVKRDSYLPQGNQGLKAVTRCKLGYDPVEIDPEDMLRFAKERPDHMASYSVSDAVATYYLYNVYVHNFIFSLSTIIPMGPEDVLRKGSGTLCETLLMVEAFRGNIVCPNKDIDPPESFYNGHLLESETYIGGHVECLEAGIFRADISNKFTLVPSALQMLIDHVDRDLTFALEIENGIQRSEISNYDEIKQEIVMALEMLRDSPIREEMPLIYHLDVGAMYPNIILTNRLQPSAIVNQNICASCEFNQSENNCKRPMSWTWRGDYNPASLSEYNSIKRQLGYEKIKNNEQYFNELTEKEQLLISHLRLKQYSHRVYNKIKQTTIEERISTVCMRENSFYVDTVRSFRDRRYEYKLLTKQWKQKRLVAEKQNNIIDKKSAEAKEILMDSLQVAHKCILNSFYGYVMRKGARWRSMEMAGIVTNTGAQLITQARILIEQVGRPLELDTDGIWCILPSSFPQDFKFKKKGGGGVVHIEYPCAMLNADVHDRYTNHQYQDLDHPPQHHPSSSPQGTSSASASSASASSLSSVNRRAPSYSTHSECSIYFELDGPYKAMVLPASPEEGILLKKKYVVFNFDNTIAELKGFELKRRGELELVKAFQSQVFNEFLNGSTLQECYNSVGKVGNLWLDVLDSHGVTMDDHDLMELISEKKTISKTLSEYEGRKATSLTTAQRLADFLGAEMIKDKGLNCNLIVAKYPTGAPVTERAIPVAIFQADPAIKTFFLRKWLQNSSIDCDDFRDIVDWDYYKDRLGEKSFPPSLCLPPSPLFLSLSLSDLPLLLSLTPPSSSPLFLTSQAKQFKRLSRSQLECKRLRILVLVWSILFG
jgi:DNA polymerase epsilon subunit 1